MKWLNPKTPIILSIVASLLGSLFGVMVYAVSTGFTLRSLNAGYTGFPTILVENIRYRGATLGAISGFVIVNVHSNYRAIVGRIGLILSSGILAFLGILSIPFLKDQGWRVSVAVNGVGIIWSILLISLSCSMLLRRDDR